jgi:DnaJ-class molecular chaperone
MPRLRGEVSGDLIAEVDVRLPVHLTEEQRQAAASFPQA